MKFRFKLLMPTKEYIITNFNDSDNKIGNNIKNCKLLILENEKQVIFTSEPSKILGVYWMKSKRLVGNSEEIIGVEIIKPDGTSEKWYINGQYKKDKISDDLKNYLLNERANK